MEQIVVTRKDGTTYPLAVKKDATGIKQATQSWGLLGDDVVNITVESPYPQSYAIGDSISVFGRTYRLNQLPRVRRTGAHKYAYDLTFEGVQYDLLRAFYDVTIETTGNTLQDVQGDALTGDLRRFATVLVSNANRVFPGKWRLGTCPATIADKTLTFGDGDNCLAVYQNLCKTFDVEATISESGGVYTIDFAKRVGVTHPFTFEFGKGKGLYALDRQNVDSSNIVTRLKVYGSSDNITNKYRAQRLCLPGKSKAQSFIEQADAVARYGVHEARKVFDDIKPTFNGKVTAVVAGGVLQFQDASMFDLNTKGADGKTTKYLVAGVSAKIHFNTGNLAGYEFDIQKYDHGTKTFTLKKLTDNRGDVFPSASSTAFQFAVGDEYKILDITLPERYQQEAEQKLQERALEYYRQNSQPKVKYGLSVAKSYLQKLFRGGEATGLFAPGDYINVKDESIGVDKAVRIQSLERNLLDVYSYTLTLADVAENNITTRVISELVDLDKITTVYKLKDPTRARANWRSTREVLDMVFDPDGDYYTDKIKPNSVDTLALSVGAKSMQFALQDVVFEPNYQGKKNAVRVSAGTLTHYAVEEQPRTWMVAQVISQLGEDATPYYIFARCPKVGNAATMIFSKSPIKVEQEAGVYHFWVGVVNSVDTTLQARSMSLTYGFSTINGRFIKTGRIESADGSTYFDLDDGEIGGRIVFSSNGREKTLADLAAESSESKDFIKNKLPGLISGLQEQIDGQIDQFFYDYNPDKSREPTKTWIESDMAAGNNNEREKHTGDLFYNTTTGKVFRYVRLMQTEHAGGGYYWQWQELSDNEVSQALAVANDAISLARTKRRIFTSTPKVPYDVGDLWVGGANGDILRCKNSRESGAFARDDWELASKYTDDSALVEFKRTYALQQDELAKQIDGKIETWFQLSDPSASWTTDETRAKHVGDMWYNTSARELKHYAKNGTRYEWRLIEDSKALAAYEAASQAQDTADGKRQVFVFTPKVPYDVGDLWVDGKELRRCITPRTATQTYNASDWVVAVAYDNTKTTIDGGLVTSGTIQVAGSTSAILAGITGYGTTPDAVRFWAGATYENRAHAPFVVLQDGTAKMSKANVSGVVDAKAGKIGGFDINEGRIGAANSYNQSTGLSLTNRNIRFRGDAVGAMAFASIGVLNWLGYSNAGLFELSSSDNHILGSALYAKCVSGDGSLDHIYPQRALEYLGNVYGVGKHCNYSTGYIGEAFSDTIVAHFDATHQFHFVSVSAPYLSVDLPTKEMIDKRTGGKSVIFNLDIVCDRNMWNKIKVQSRVGAQLFNNDGIAIEGVDMARGDALVLRYYDGGYHILSQHLYG